MEKAAQNKDSKKKLSHTRILFWFFIGLLISVTLLRYAEPTKDGDIFFHLVYGKTILETGNLIIDHTLYSWTPSSNENIYCAWFGQLILYFVHSIGGFNLLFFFRYLCLFISLIIVLPIMRTHDFSDHSFPLFMLLIVSMGSYAGVFLKPEIISLVFMSLSAFLYFQAKLQLYKKISYKLLLFFPLIMLIWVNTHGVWIFGIIIFTILFAGEILNKLFGANDKFDPLLLKYLTISYFSTLPLLLINPYGLNYAVKPVTSVFKVLFPSFLSNNVSINAEKIRAYDWIFDTIYIPGLHFISLLLIMTGCFLFFYTAYIITNKKYDFSILFINLSLCFLFARYVRSTYYWGPFWLMSIIYLAKNSEFSSFFFKPLINRMKHGVVTLAFLLLSIFTIYETISIPFPNNWLGFGLNSWAPVEESLFLKKNKLGTKLYNSYLTGAYLMFDLYPDHKVFIDARQFPYGGVFKDYIQFQNGQMSLETLNEKYPFDSALVEYHYHHIIPSFVNSKKWITAYYGPYAAVFLKNISTDSFDFKNTPLERFDKLRNLKQASKVFSAAMNFNDIKAAEYIFNLMEKKFRVIKDYKSIITDSREKLNGIKAFNSKQYDTAYVLLSKRDDQTIITITNAMVNLRVTKCRQLASEKKYIQALVLIEKNLAVLPYNPNFLYFAGLMAYLSQDKSNTNQTKYKQYFNKLISKYPDHDLTNTAIQLLENRQNLSLPMGL